MILWKSAVSFTPDFLWRIFKQKAQMPCLIKCFCAINEFIFFYSRLFPMLYTALYTRPRNALMKIKRDRVLAKITDCAIIQHNTFRLANFKDKR